MGRPRKARTLDDFPDRPSFSVSEFSELTGCNIKTVHKAIDAHKIRTVYPGSHRIPRAVVEQALAVDLKEAQHVS